MFCCLLLCFRIQEACHPSRGLQKPVNRLQGFSNMIQVIITGAQGCEHCTNPQPGGPRCCLMTGWTDQSSLVEGSTPPSPPPPPTRAFVARTSTPVVTRTLKLPCHIKIEQGRKEFYHFVLIHPSFKHFFHLIHRANTCLFVFFFLDQEA